MTVDSYAHTVTIARLETQLTHQIADSQDNSNSYLSPRRQHSACFDEA